GPRAPTAQVFVVQKEVLVDPAEFAPAIPADEQAATGHPRHLAAMSALEGPAAAARPAAEQAGDDAPQGRIRSRRSLPAAVGMFQAKADDARARVFRRNALRRG